MDADPPAQGVNIAGRMTAVIMCHRQSQALAALEARRGKKHQAIKFLAPNNFDGSNSPNRDGDVTNNTNNNEALRLGPLR